MPIPKKDDNLSKYFKLHKNGKYILDERNIGKNYRNLRSNRLDIGSYVKNNLL